MLHFKFEFSKDNFIHIDQPVLISDDEYTAEPINNFNCTLPCGDVKQVLINLKNQISSPTLDDYIEAINYYIENDAFIDKENPYNKPQGGYKIWGMAGTSDKTDI